MAWNGLHKNTEQDFWERCIPEPNTGCWLWFGTCRCEAANASGVFSFNGRPVSAHRLAFMLANGSAPIGQVNHHCDQHLCINPSHLYDGTQLDNMRDRLRRNRWHGNHGEAGPSKLKNEDVLEIRRLVAAGMSRRRAANQFGISASQASRIVSGARWGHI